MELVDLLCLSQPNAFRQGTACQPPSNCCQLKVGHLTNQGSKILKSDRGALDRWLGSAPPGADKHISCESLEM